MSLPDNFIIVDGLLTVERIIRPSWIVRRRLTDTSLTAQYAWVCNVVETAERECTIKAFLAKNEYRVSQQDRRAMQRIGEALEFDIGRYERVDLSGNLRSAVEMWRRRK